MGKRAATLDGGCFGVLERMTETVTYGSEGGGEPQGSLPTWWREAENIIRA